MHLDRDVANSSEFITDVKVELRQQMDQMYTYSLTGRCDDILREIEKLNQNLCLYNRILEQR